MELEQLQLQKRERAREGEASKIPRHERFCGLSDDPTHQFKATIATERECVFHYSSEKVSDEGAVMEAAASFGLSCSGAAAAPPKPGLILHHNMSSPSFLASPRLPSLASVSSSRSQQQQQQPMRIPNRRSNRNTLVKASRIAAAAPPSVKQKQKQKHKQEEEEEEQAGVISVRSVCQNGDPLGQKHLGKSVVRWICQGMRAMAADFASAEARGEFSEVRQRMGTSGLTFVIQAQPYLNAIPMPKGFEAVCLKARTHYPTLFDHFQRELRDVLLSLHDEESLSAPVQDWRKTQSWILLKELAKSGIYFDSSIEHTFILTSLPFNFTLPCPALPQPSVM